EVDRRLEARHDSEWSLHMLQPRVRNRHATADARRPNFLTLQQRTINDAFLDAQCGGRPRREIMQQAALVVEREVRDRIDDGQVLNVHELRLNRPKVASPAQVGAQATPSEKKRNAKRAPSAFMISL